MKDILRVKKAVHDRKLFGQHNNGNEQQGDRSHRSNLSIILIQLIKLADLKEQDDVPVLVLDAAVCPNQVSSAAQGGMAAEKPMTHTSMLRQGLTQQRLLLQLQVL